MRRFVPCLFFVTTLITCAVNSRAQGGIGNMPREDIVMLRATERDSLSDIVMANIMDLKRYAEQNMIDSAATLIAFSGSVPAGAKANAPKEGRWSRALDVNNPDEKTRASMLLDKFKKIVAQYPTPHGEYYAAFKDKESPSGQKHLYQINFLNDKSKRMVSFTFYPIDGKLLLGDIN